MYKSYKIKNFIDLSLEEHKQILKWRNSTYVSQWMLHKHIFLNEHLKFVENLKNSNKLYFLVEDIGVIYFTIKNNYIEVGLYKNPNKQKVGKKLLEIGLNEAFKYKDKIILHVLEKNKKAINLYKKFGFKIVNKKDNLLKMKLTTIDKKI